MTYSTISCVSASIVHFMYHDDILLVCEADRRTDSGAAALLQGGVAHRPQRFYRMRIMEEER